MGRVARWLRALFGGKKPPPAVTPKPAVRDNKRWGGSVKYSRENDKTKADATVPYDEEQNKRAIAVAAATAAVADAAVAAAQAAAAVVRLTSSGRVVTGVGYGGKRAVAEAAAVKIQAAFRAYLARRAFRALKGLVKLQAIVRGNIVRKQAAETLRCMQALVRVQARARACRALRSDRDQLKMSSRLHHGPSTPEKSEQRVRSNAGRSKKSSPLKRTPSKQTSSNGRLEQERLQSSSGYPWLDQWMEERYWDASNSEKNAKILEIDTGKPHHNPKRQAMSFTTVSESSSKDSTIIDTQQQQTPTKSECSRSLFGGYSNYPNYMENTKSSRAKVRSQSAPRQRPELEKSGSIKRGGQGLGQQWQRSSWSKAYPGSGRLDRLGMPTRI